MLSNMYSVFDKVSRDYAPPFVAKNDACARRFFDTSMKSNTLINPNDFELYRIGTFESETGLCESLPEPVVCVDSSEVLQ